MPRRSRCVCPAMKRPSSSQFLSTVKPTTVKSDFVNANLPLWMLAKSYLVMELSLRRVFLPLRCRAVLRRWWLFR